MHVQDAQLNLYQDVNFDKRKKIVKDDSLYILFNYWHFYTVDIFFFKFGGKYLLLMLLP